MAFPDPPADAAATLSETAVNAEPPSVDVIMLATPEIESYAWLAKDSWHRYCARHGYRFTVFDERLVPDMHINWTKIEAMRRTLATSTEAFVLLVDADLVVLRPDLPLLHLADASKDIVFASDNLMPRLWPDLRNLAIKLRLRMASLPNAGFMLARRNDFALAFFTQWLALARGELAHWADLHPRNQNVLWRGLVAQNRKRLTVLDRQILRVTDANRLAEAVRRGPFAMHFKHEWVDVNAVLQLLPADG